MISVAPASADIKSTTTHLQSLRTHLATTINLTASTAPVHPLDHQQHPTSTPPPHTHNHTTHPAVLARVILGLIFLTAIIPISIICLRHKYTSIKAACRKAAEDRRATKGKAPMHPLPGSEGAGDRAEEGGTELREMSGASTSVQDTPSEGSSPPWGEAAAGRVVPQRGLYVARLVAEFAPLPKISARTAEDERTIAPFRAVAGEADAYGRGFRGEGFGVLRGIGKRTVRIFRRIRVRRVVGGDEEVELGGPVMSGAIGDSGQVDREQGYYEPAQEGSPPIQHLEAADQAEAVRKAYAVAAASRTWGSPA